MVKRSNTRQPLRLKVKCTRDLTYEETFEAMVWLCRRDPEAFARIVEIVKMQEGEVDCKFPGTCKKFPCETLFCGAVALDHEMMPI